MTDEKGRKEPLQEPDSAQELSQQHAGYYNLLATNVGSFVAFEDLSVSDQLANPFDTVTTGGYILEASRDADGHYALILIVSRWLKTKGPATGFADFVRSMYFSAEGDTQSADAAEVIGEFNRVYPSGTGSHIELEIPEAPVRFAIENIEGPVVWIPPEDN